MARSDNDTTIEQIEVERDRADFYSRFFSFVINKLTYSENSYRIFNSKEHLGELIKMLTNPSSFADRFITLKTLINLDFDNSR